MILFVSTLTMAITTNNYRDENIFVVIRLILITTVISKRENGCDWERYHNGTTVVTKFFTVTVALLYTYANLGYIKSTFVRRWPRTMHKLYKLKYSSSDVHL